MQNQALTQNNILILSISELGKAFSKDKIVKDWRIGYNSQKGR